MAATVTLDTTTFANTVAIGDTSVLVASTSGLAPGVRLYADRELMAVVRVTGNGNEVVVLRGRDGTATRRHATNVTVYIGRADQFYEADPIGAPPTVVPVSPLINVFNGAIWIAQGDDDGADSRARVWAQVTTTMVTGALGIRSLVVTTPN